MRTLGLALTMVALLVSACTGSTPSASASPKTSPSALKVAAAPTQLCFIELPIDWAMALSHVVATLDGVNFSAAVVDEQQGMAYGGAWTPSGQQIAAVDLSTGKMTEIAPMSPNGFAWMTYGGDWLAWPQVGIGGTSIQLWNSRTKERRQIATSGLPGTAAVGNGRVLWTEGTVGSPGVLLAYELATGKSSTLDSGLLRPPVFAGKFLVWEKQAPGADNPAFVFADATTLQPVVAPAELRAPRDIGSVAGSQDYLIWTGASQSSPDSGTWFVDDLATGSIRTYGARNHYLQFPELAGPFLVWFASDKNSIVDLRSGVGIDFPLPGGVGAAGDTFVVVRISTAKGSVNRSELSVLHPSQLSRLQAC